MMAVDAFPPRIKGKVIHLIRMFAYACASIWKEVKRDSRETGESDK